MTSFDWSVLTASLAGGLGVGVIAMTALRRHRTRRRTKTRKSAQEADEGGSMSWRLTKARHAPGSENETPEQGEWISEIRKRRWHE